MITFIFCFWIEYIVDASASFAEMDARRTTEICRTYQIFDAVVGCNTSAVESQIKTDSKVLEETTEEGWTPLHVSVIYQNEKIIDLLLEKGSDPSVKDSDGKNPLHWAAHRNVSFVIFNKLVSVIDRDLLNASDKYGRTPLHYLCLKDSSCKEAYFERKNICQDLVLKLNLLLRAKVDLHIADSEGKTPLLLWSANVHNFYESEEINFDELPLIGYGRAEVNHEKFLGKSPFHYADRPKTQCPLHCEKPCLKTGETRSSCCYRTMPKWTCKIFGDVRLCMTQH